MNLNTPLMKFLASFSEEHKKLVQEDIDNKESFCEVFVLSSDASEDENLTDQNVSQSEEPETQIEEPKIQNEVPETQAKVSEIEVSNDNSVDENSLPDNLNNTENKKENYITTQSIEKSANQSEKSLNKNNNEISRKGKNYITSDNKIVTENDGKKKVYIIKRKYTILQSIKPKTPKIQRPSEKEKQKKSNLDSIASCSNAKIKINNTYFNKKVNCINIDKNKKNASNKSPENNKQPNEVTTNTQCPDKITQTKELNKQQIADPERSLLHNYFITNLNNESETIMYDPIKYDVSDKTPECNAISSTTNNKLYSVFVDKESGYNDIIFLENNITKENNKIFCDTCKERGNYVHNNKGKFPCNVCNVAFASGFSSLRIHKLKHTNKAIKVCEPCMNGYIQEVRDSKIFFKYERVLMCFKCDTFKTELVIGESNTLLRKPYKCVCCFIEFEQFSAFQQHMNIHVQTFICDKCERARKTQKVLNSRT